MSQQSTADDPTHRTQPPTDPAFEAIAAPDTLATALDALDALVDECVFRVSEDGLAVEAMDPATVAMVALDLDADAFDAFSATGDLRLGVPLDRLRDVVGIADSGQPVRLALDAETRTLHVRVGELAYTLALIDPDAIRSPPDRVDLAEQYEGTATLAGGEVARAVDAADMVADYLALGSTGDAVYVRADGDTDSVAIEFDREDCVELDAPDVESLFSLSYLASVTKPLPGDGAVDLRFGEEAPVELGFDIAEGAGRVSFVVSPRMTVS